jgi:hypothetical protein
MQTHRAAVRELAMPRFALNRDPEAYVFGIEALKRCHVDLSGLS